MNRRGFLRRLAAGVVCAGAALLPYKRLDEEASELETIRDVIDNGEWLDGTFAISFVGDDGKMEDLGLVRDIEVGGIVIPLARLTRVSI